MEDHDSNHANLNFRLLCKQKASSHLFLAASRCVCYLFSADFRMDIRLYLKRKLRLRLSSEDSHRLTRSKGRCSETHGRWEGGGRLDASFPNATLVVEQRRKSRRKPTKVPILKLFRSFFCLRSILRSPEAIKVRNWRLTMDRRGR